MAGGRPALIVSPRLAGHRQVYCRVLGEALHSLGHDVVIATADPRTDERPQLAALISATDATVVRLSEAWQRGGDRSELGGLVRQTGAAVTVLTEADALLDVLLAGVMPSSRLPTRLVAIFLRTTSYGHPGVPRGGWRRGMRHPSRLRRHERVFHDILVRPLRLVDVALCLDEFFVASHRQPYAWLPDIYRTFEDEPGEESAVWRSRVAAFVAENPGRPMVAYVGTSQRRRGYGTLLRLADEIDGCFLHCGMRLDEEDDAESRRVRVGLEAGGRLLETGGYYREYATAQVFLQAASCVALPYLDHFGASGVMLQALDAGRPVVVPSVGLMAERVRRHGLGLTYAQGDAVGLGSAFRQLDQEGPARHQAALRAFLAWFSPRQVQTAIAHAVGTAPEGAHLPLHRARKP